MNGESDERTHELLDEEAIERPQGMGRTIRLAAAFAIVTVLGFGAGLTVGADSGTHVLNNLPLLGDRLDATPDESADLDNFWKAWNALNGKFVETSASTTIPTAKDKVWGAIQGLTQSYKDPYTIFMPPEEAKIFQEDISGNFGGVGMEIGINKDGILTVIAPLKGTPAERAGMLSGDLVVTIDGTSTDGMSSDEAVKLIRGPKGTNVSFKVLREGEMIDVTITRDIIQVPTIDQQYNAETGIYTISLYSFTANSSNLFNKALGEFRRSGATKLIIDLRGNPGGYLDAAVSMASHFLPRGAAVVTEDYRGKRQNVVHESSGIGGVPSGSKVVILIDQGSASASEILAGALQDADVATLVGTRSFGKGSVQELVEIGGGSLKVTVARWLTPAGRSISDGGLAADIYVERTRDDVLAGKDPQMARAIEFLTTGQ